MSWGLEADKREGGAEHDGVADQTRQDRSRVAPPLFDAILDLQRLAGNEAVTNLLQPLAVQRVGVPYMPPPGTGEANLLPENYEKMDDGGKIAAIRQMLAEGKKVNAVYGRAWSMLGDEVAAARANPDVFAQSVTKDDDILDHAAFDPLRESFKKDVEGTALNYTHENRQLVIDEMKRTGVEDEQKGKEPGADADAGVQDIQRAAADMEKLKLAKEKALGQKIGYKKRVSQVGWVRAGEAIFEPGGPPVFYEPTPPLPTWEEVNKQWMLLMAMEGALIRKHPSAAFFMREGVPPALKDAADAKGARAEIAKALGDLLGKIEKVVPLIGSDLKYIDFPPIQQQLLGGQPGPSGTNWSQPVEKAVAKEEIADANIGKLLTTLGVSTVGAALFVLASIATAGGAAAAGAVLFGLGAGVGVAQAGMSWDKYSDLAKAHAATVDPEMALVTGEQVDDAQFSALLDTVFAVLDVWQGVKGAYVGLKGGKAALEAGKAGAEMTTRVALTRLGKAANPREVVLKGLDELGHDSVSKLTGLSYQELAEIVGKESDIGKRLLFLGRVGMPEDVAKLLEKLPQLGNLSAAEGEQVLKAALETHGHLGTLKKVGGWGAIKRSPAFVDQTAPAKAMEAWRAGIAKELEQYIAKESDAASKAVRTGSDLPKSDMDMQIIGGAAGVVQAKAEGWLAGRLGTSIEESKKLLDAAVFVDPLRSHLAQIMKELSPAIRAQITQKMIAEERAMIYGARFREAEKVSKQAGEKVLQEAKDLGVTVMKEFQPLSPADQKRAAELVDGMIKELTEISGDPSKADRTAKLVEQISRTEASIKASNPDAYVGGGVHVWVSGRDTDVAKIAEAAGLSVEQLKSISNSSRLTAALTEAKWLDAGVKRLTSPKMPKSPKDITALAGAVVNIGKHGERAAQQLKLAGVANAGDLTALIERLQVFGKMTAEEAAAKITAGELGTMRTEIDGLLAQLKDATKKGVDSLGADARTLGVDTTQMVEFQRLLSWQVTYATYVDAARNATAAYIELLHMAIQSQQKQASEVPPEREPNYQPAEGPPIFVP